MSDSELNSNDLLVCAKCGEDAVLVEYGGEATVRVRRKTKCKKYRPILGAANSPTCQFARCSSASEAVKAWNEAQTNNPDQGA